jgi:hypothetical protein
MKNINIPSNVPAPYFSYFLFNFEHNQKFEQKKRIFLYFYFTKVLIQKIHDTFCDFLTYTNFLKYF